MNLRNSPGISTRKDQPSPDSKGGRRRMYDAINRHLGWLQEGDTILHLNYGYVSDERPRRSPFSARDGNSCTDLVLEVIGRCRLDGCELVDVGCGRGGTIQVVLEYFAGVRSITGIDLSSEAVEFCLKRYPRAAVPFIVGDAEHLPLRSEMADVVINIESACCYPDVFSFYRETRRVLKPSGRFLYADSIEVDDEHARLEFLRNLGFAVLDRRDITRNIVRACDRRAEDAAAGGRDHTMDAITGSGDTPISLNPFLANLVAMPGSRKYQKYATGIERYVIFDLQKEPAA